MHRYDDDMFVGRN